MFMEMDKGAVPKPAGHCDRKHTANRIAINQGRIKTKKELFKGPRKRNESCNIGGNVFACQRKAWQWEKERFNIRKQFQAALYAAITTTKESSATTGDLYQMDRRICERAGQRPLTQRRVSDIIAELDMLGQHVTRYEP